MTETFRHKDKIMNAGCRVDTFIDEIAAIVRWKDGAEFLWIDGKFCTMSDGAMIPREVIYNLKYLSPSERKEAIEGIKSMATLVSPKPRTIDEAGNEV